MEMIFHSRANNTHFHKEGCALGPTLEARVFGTRKRPNPALHKVDLLPASKGRVGIMLLAINQYSISGAFEHRTSPHSKVDFGS